MRCDSRSYFPSIKKLILSALVYRADNENDSGFNHAILKIFAPEVRSAIYDIPQFNFLVNGSSTTAPENDHFFIITLGSIPHSLIIHDTATVAFHTFWFTFAHKPGATASHSAVNKKCHHAVTGRSVICVAALGILQAVILVHTTGV